MTIDNLIEKIKNEIIEFGDGELEFQTRDISDLLNHIKNLEVELTSVKKRLIESIDKNINPLEEKKTWLS